MPKSIISDRNSKYNQNSFLGGMNLLGDDSYLNTNSYRVGFNLTNRFGELDLIPSSILDLAAPAGLKQGLVTFGNYLVLFCNGRCYYKFYSDMSWTIIPTFVGMSEVAPRYWIAAVPVSTTNYLRTSILSSSGNLQADSGLGVNANTIAGASQGNLNGLLVQDNINQPQFIYLNGYGIPVSRTTQTFPQWSIQFTDATNVTVVANGDNREYVPIGNCMAWANGILFVVSPDFNTIYRSVSGRPLDFVVNVPSGLSTNNPYIMYGGGDATTTSTSVGVGGISCIRPLSSGGIFVSASGANFSLVPNTTPGAPTIFAEYTFIRTFLFNSFCLSDRATMDSIGDTRFIDLTGIRSFNAVQQYQNEGRNSPFSATIQSIFGPDQSTIVQDTLYSSCTLYNNYELYSVNTIKGKAIAKYDTINSCWVSFDINQTPNVRIKQFAPLQINVLALFCITEDDQVYQLYASQTETDSGAFRTIGVTSNILYANVNIKMNNPENEVKLLNTRIILNKITEDCTVGITRFTNNKVHEGDPNTKSITFEEIEPYTDDYTLPDVNTQLTNVVFPSPDAPQGWKVFSVITWNGGTITQFSMELKDLTPMNPTNSQGIVE